MDWGDDPKMAPPIISSILSTLQTKPWWNVLGLFGPFITLGPKDWGYEISWVDFIRMVPINFGQWLIHIEVSNMPKIMMKTGWTSMNICSCRRSKTCWHKRMLGVFTGCGRVNLGNLGQVNSSLYLGNIYIYMYDMHEKIDQDQNSEGFANNPTNLIGKHLIIPSNYQWHYPNYLNSHPNIINKYQ